MQFEGKEELVKQVQRGLGLEPDGDDGVATWSLLAARYSSTVGGRVGLTQISDKALDLILKYEVGGGESYYNRYLYRPVWPGAFSGVTIGIGYDLGYNSLDNFRDTWEGKLDSNSMSRLSRTIGTRGRHAKDLISSVKNIVIPWKHALEVFKTTTLPTFTQLTINTFPGVDRLHPDAYGALVSLVFNRGSSLTGSRRIEMKRIRDLVPRKDYRGIAREIRSMKRLWIGAGVDGLLRRRDEEANLVENCAR